MKIKLLLVGKTTEEYLKEGENQFVKRIKKYIQLEISTISVPKNASKMSVEEQKRSEGEKLLQKISGTDYVMLLDEGGKEMKSEGFSQLLQKHISSNNTDIIFIVGGAYGFSTTVYKRANATLSLSKMTFTHQMVRLFFLEQLYRAFTIMRNEPYHHR